MIGSPRYPNALPARLIRGVEAAGREGLTGTALREMMGDQYEDARDLLSRLGTAGRVHASGPQTNRRWFIDPADALIWEERRPRTQKELRAAASLASPAEKEAKRAARLAQLSAARPRHVWTDEQVEILRAVYPTQGIRLSAEKTGQTAGAVRSKVALLGIKCVKRPPYVRTGAEPVTRREKRRQRQEGKPGTELVVTLPGSATVQVKKARGPADQPGEPIYHPNFKFTRCPDPPAPLRTNTHSILL